MRIFKRDELLLKRKKYKSYWKSEPSLYNQDLPTKTNIEFNNDFLIELWNFLKVRKKIWLAPIIFIMLILGGLLILAEGSVMALLFIPYFNF